MEQDTHADIDVDVEMDAEDNEGEEEEEGSEEEDRTSEEEDEFCAGPGLTYTGVRGMRVLSTADVPDQRCRTNAATLRSLLPVICQRLIRKSLPRELAMLVVNSIDLGVSRERAERHRLEFMDDRRAKVKREDKVLRSPLCLTLQSFNNVVDL